MTLCMVLSHCHRQITAALERPSPNVAIALLMDLSNTISDFERDANGETQQLKLVDEVAHKRLRSADPNMILLAVAESEGVYEASSTICSVSCR